MKEFFYNFFLNTKKKFDSLNDITKLLVYVFLLAILISGVFLISKIHIRNGIMDYKNYNFDAVKEEYEENEDRMIYLNIDQIIRNLIATESNLYSIDNEKVKINDFYEYTLHSDLKDYISKNKFKKYIENLSNDFSIEYGNENPLEVYEKNLVDKIYIFEDNMYIAELNLNENSYYIGIFVKNYNYSIFYINM